MSLFDRADDEQVLGQSNNNENINLISNIPPPN